MSMRFQIFRYHYFAVNFTALVVAAGINPPTCHKPTIATHIDLASSTS